MKCFKNIEKYKKKDNNNIYLRILIISIHIGFPYSDYLLYILLQKGNSISKTATMSCDVNVYGTKVLNQI